LTVCRQLALTAPYMHNGHHAALRAVVKHRVGDPGGTRSLTGRF